MTTFSDINKKNMIEALEKSLGVITTACKSVGIALAEGGQHDHIAQ